MEATDTARPGVGTLLRDLNQASPAGLVEVCAAWLRRHLSAQACVLLLADYGEVSLEPVPDVGASPSTGREDMIVSPAGVAYREQRRVHQPAEQDPAQVVVYLPVSIRTERLGVLEVTLPGRSLGRDVANVLDDVSQVLGYVLAGARRYTDNGASHALTALVTWLELQGRDAEAERIRCRGLAG